jgi:hypothetical protein
MGQPLISIWFPVSIDEMYDLRTELKVLDSPIYYTGLFCFCLQQGSNRPYLVSKYLSNILHTIFLHLNPVPQLSQ